MQSNEFKQADIMETNISEHTRSKFLSHISHGIRTPLNSIMGFSKLLIEKQLIEGQPKEYAKHIITSSNELLNFIENLIDLSQFDSHNYEIEVQPVNLNTLLWNISESFIFSRHDFNSYHISLKVNVDPEHYNLSLQTDYELLKKSIIRLINLVALITGITNLSIEYYTENENVKIVIRENLNNNTQKSLVNLDNFIGGQESFNHFNYEVLSSSIKMIGGDVCVEKDSSEYYIKVPIKWTNQDCL